MSVFKSTSFFLVAAAIFSGIALPVTVAAATCSVGADNESPLQLEARLAQCQAEIKAQSVLVDQKSKQATSLQRDISILKTKIEKAKTEIKARDLNIKKLNGGIQEKQQQINSLQQKIARMQASTAKLLREAYALESASFYQVLLSDQSLSSFFSDLDSFGSIDGALKNLFGQIKVAKAQNEDHKEQLESKKGKEAALKSVQLIEKKKTEVLQSEKDLVLKVTRKAKYRTAGTKQRIAARS